MSEYTVDECLRWAEDGDWSAGPRSAQAMQTLAREVRRLRDADTGAGQWWQCVGRILEIKVNVLSPRKRDTVMNVVFTHLGKLYYVDGLPLDGPVPHDSEVVLTVRTKP